MEQTLQALGGLMVKAIPTMLFFIFLYYFFKVMLFGPLAKVLKQREELTAGARKGAESSLAEAERKQREYEAKFNEARAEVYRSQEETRKKWLEDQTAAADAAKAEADQKVHTAKAQITGDAATARENLVASAGTLADHITSVVLARRVGGGGA
jgi:F-type H+-transporting ATPase subunit b